jgi:DNA-binding response OmpR family regulator
MDHLPRVLLVEKAAKQQLAIESFLRREGFQWDLANSGEQAVSSFTRLSSSGSLASGGPASGYELVVLGDSVRVASKAELVDIALTAFVPVCS